MTLVRWTLTDYGKHRGFTLDMLGLIPAFLFDHDPRPAREQFNDNYCAGWTPMHGFTLMGKRTIKYPGDPPMQPLATATLRDETICFYEGAFVAIFQPNGSFEAARMD